MDTSPKVDLSPYFSKVGLDSSNSGIRQRFNVDRSGYPPVTYGGRVGVLFQNFCWGWVAEVPTLHTFLGWVAKVTTPHTLTWRMFSFWLGCEPWERQMFWNQNSSTMRYNKVKRDWLLLLDIFLMYADIHLFLFWGAWLFLFWKLFTILLLFNTFAGICRYHGRPTSTSIKHYHFVIAQTTFSWVVHHLRHSV